MFAYCLNNPVNMIDSNGADPVPGWAQRINNGTATTDDYLAALVADPSAWAGSARRQVDNAIGLAKGWAKKSVVDYASDFWDAANKSAYLIVGVGVGAGGDISFGDAELGAEIHFNLINIKVTNSGYEFYSSFYVGIQSKYMMIEDNLEDHVIFDWRTLKWDNISENDPHLGNIEIGGSAYVKGFGGQIRLGFE